MRIDQRPLGIEASALEVVRPVHAERVASAGARAARGQKAVPYVARAARQIVARSLGAAVGIENAKLHAGSEACEKREIHPPLAGQGRAQRARGPHLNWLHRS